MRQGGGEICKEAFDRIRAFFPPVFLLGGAEDCRICRGIEQGRRFLAQCPFDDFLKRQVSCKDVVSSVEKYYGSWATKVTEGLRPCVAAFESLPGIESAADVEAIVATYCDDSRTAIAELLASGTPKDLLADEIKELSRSWLSVRIPTIIDQVCEA